MNALRKISSIDAAGLAVIGLLTAAFVFGLIEPVRQQQQQQSVLLKSKVAKRQKENIALAELRSLDGRVKDLQNRLAGSKLQLRSPSEINPCVAELIEMCGRMGLSVQNLQPAPAQRSGRYTVTPIRLTGRGRYTQCVAFLHGVIEQTGDVGVRAYTLRGSPENPEAPCDFELDLSWLAQPADAAVPTAVAATPVQ